MVLVSATAAEHIFYFAAAYLGGDQVLMREY